MITISWPPHLVLAGLEETEYGFMAYLRVRGQFYLQGARGPTAQAAIDLAAARVAKYYTPLSPPPSLEIDLSDLDLSDL